MDLRSFVHQSLVEIITGVEDAQKDRGDAAWLINPKLRGGWKVRDVEFDVALTVANKTNGVVVASPEIGGKGKQSKEQSYVSRVKFAVPIVFPMTEGAPAGGHS